MLYEDATRWANTQPSTCNRHSEKPPLLLYVPAMDMHQEKMTSLADRVFCFYEMPKVPTKSRAKADPKMPKAEVALEAYS